MKAKVGSKVRWTEQRSKERAEGVIIEFDEGTYVCVERDSDMTRVWIPISDLTLLR